MASNATSAQISLAKHEFFGDSGKMHHADGRRRLEIQQEIAIGDRVHAVCRDLRETELLSHVLPVDGVRHARKRTAPERQHVGSLVCLAKALAIAVEHLEVSEHVVSEEHGLRALQMCIPRHHNVEVGFGDCYQRGLQALDGLDDLCRQVLGVEPHVHRDLVVSRPRRMQPARRVADLLEQAPLDVHVDIFELRPPGERALLDLNLNGAEAFDDGVCLIVRDDTLPGQHSGMGDGAGDVLPVQAPVVVDGYRISCRGLVH